MACGWDRVYHHLQGAKTSLKVSVGGICWWDLDCKGTWASAACSVSLPSTQLAPAALSPAARAGTRFSCLSDNAHYHSSERSGSSASESGPRGCFFLIDLPQWKNCEMSFMELSTLEIIRFVIVCIHKLIIHFVPCGWDEWQIKQQ